MVCAVKVNMESNKEEVYFKLKSKIINVLEKTCKIEHIKAHFEHAIDSPRDLSHAKTFSDIIFLLEERDVLNHHNILPLFHLGEFLKDEDILNLTNTYKKIYIDDNSTVCSCGVTESYSPPMLILNQYENVQMVNAHFSNSTNSDLQQALKNISRRIGKHWMVLISELKVYQSQLDLVYKEYPNDTESQVYKALQYWLKNEKENATLEALDKALNARLCKVKGIGSHLKEPIADIT